MGSGSNISSINPRNVCEEDLKKIYEIERDMWARDDGLGEYIKCNNCNSISSKEDVFFDLSNDIKNEVVSKIEKLLNLTHINCPKCGSEDTCFCFGEDYINDIIERYTKSESYLVVYRDSNNVIRGFIDGYIDGIDVIYKREFERYYGTIGLNKIKELIENIICKTMYSEFFYCSSVGIEEKYKNFIVVISLLKMFFENIKDNGRNVPGISELRLGTSIHILNILFGAKSIGVNSLLKSTNNHKQGFYSDVFITENLVSSYMTQLSIPTKVLLKKILNYKKLNIL